MLHILTHNVVGVPPAVLETQLGYVGMVSWRTWISCRAERVRQMSSRVLFYFWIMLLSVLMGLWQWDWCCPQAMLWSAMLVWTLLKSPQCDRFVIFMWTLKLWACWGFRWSLSGSWAAWDSHDGGQKHSKTTPHLFNVHGDILLTQFHCQVQTVTATAWKVAQISLPLQKYNSQQGILSFLSFYYCRFFCWKYF